MANIHAYFGIESLNLTTQQKNTLVSGLQGLGLNNSGDKPNHKNHWRIRLDENAAIFEALFDSETLTIAAIKQRLATIFNVAVGTITHSTSQQSVGLVVTFTHSAQQKLRMVCFGMSGGIWPEWSVSNQAVRDYLATNAAAWESAT